MEKMAASRFTDSPIYRGLPEKWIDLEDLIAGHAIGFSGFTPIQTGMIKCIETGSDNLRSDKG